MPNAATHLWHKLIGKDDEFHVLIAASAGLAQTSVSRLVTYLEQLRQGTPSPQFTDFAEPRRKQKQIRMQTIEELNKSLVPPFDREDIQALAFALYRIPKVVEKIVERLSIYPGQVPHDAFQRLAELLSIAADALVELVQAMLAREDIAKAEAANQRLQAAEGDADKLMLSLLQELYRSSYSEKDVVILQSIYELIERAVDRCRTAGNIVIRIMLKGT